MALLQCRAEFAENVGTKILVCGQCVLRCYCSPACQVPFFCPDICYSSATRCFSFDCASHAYCRLPTFSLHGARKSARLARSRCLCDLPRGNQSKHWLSTHHLECAELGEQLCTCCSYQSLLLPIAMPGNTAHAERPRFRRPDHFPFAVTQRPREHAPLVPHSSNAPAGVPRAQQG